MLKIQVFIRNTHEFTHASIAGPTKKQTKKQFEQAFIDGDDCYCIGDTFEILPYFDLEGKSNSIDVYLGGDDCIENDEKPVFVTSNWSDFEFEKGGGCNFAARIPDKAGEVNVWWSHDMKFNNVYFWTDVDEFDPDKLKVQFGVDQNGEKYLENFIYDGEYPDDYNDFGDCGNGYSEPEFVYHPKQKFAK